MLKKAKELVGEGIAKAKEILHLEKPTNGYRISHDRIRFKLRLNLIFLGILAASSACADASDSLNDGDLSFYSETTSDDPWHEFDAFGEKRLAVFLTNFSDTEQPEISREEVYQYIIEEMGEFFEDSSYGQMTITGDVFDWYQSIETQSCVSDTEEAFKVNQIDSETYTYDHFLLIAPFGNKEGGCGRGGFSGGGQFAWVDSKTLFSLNPWGAAAHELGHNLGLHLKHASTLDCNSNNNVPENIIDCNIQAYGDHFDVMGNPYKSRFTHNSIHREKLGWLTAEDIIEVQRNGVYTINSLESPSGVRALKIPRDPENNDFLYIEKRAGESYSFKNTPHEQNPSEATNAFNGALLYLSVPKPIILEEGQTIDPNLISTKIGEGESTEYYLSIDSALVNANPGNTDPYFSALEPGRKFIDPKTDKAIEVIKIDDNSLTVNITTASETDTKPPVCNLKIENDSRTSPEDPLEGIVTFSAEAQDESGILKVEFHFESSNKSDIIIKSANKPPYQFEIDMDHLANRTYFQVYAIAYDNNNYPNVTNSETLEFISKNNADKNMPDYLLTEPVDGGVYSKNVPIDILATDDYAIYKISVFINHYEEILYLSDHINLRSEVAIQTNTTMDVGENQYIQFLIIDFGGNSRSFARKITMVE